MKALLILFAAVLLTGVTKEATLTGGGKKMTVSQMRTTKTFEDLMPKLPKGWKVDSFSICSACKRCDFACGVNAGEIFDAKTLLHVQRAKAGDTYILGNPVYADSFGIKTVTERFITFIAIKDDPPKN